MSNSSYNNNINSLRGFVQGSYNTITQFFHDGAEQVAKLARWVIERKTSDSDELIRLQNEYLSNTVAIEYEKLAIDKERLQIDKSRLSQQNFYTQKRIELEETQIRLNRQYFIDRLQLIEKQNSESRVLKEKEIQAIWDSHQLRFIVSRESTKKILQTSGDNFWIVIAPPKCPRDAYEFEDLEVYLNSRLNALFEEYYYDLPVDFCQIFNQPIKGMDALDASFFLSENAIHTFIIHSEITRKEVIITLTPPISLIDSSNSIINSSKRQTLLTPWNWKEAQKELKSCILDEEQVAENLVGLIIAIHSVLGFYFSDLFCLRINSFHRLRLCSFIEEGFPESLQGWVQPFQSHLEEFQKYRKIEDIESLSREALRSGNYETAIHGYKKLIQLNPKKSGFYYKNLATSLSKNNNISEAIDAYKIALEHSPKDHEITYEYAEILRQNNFTTESIREFEKLIEIITSSFLLKDFLKKNRVYSKLARLCIKLESFDKAFHYFKEAVSQEEHDISVWKNYCQLSRQLNKFGEAFHSLSTVLALDSEVWREEWYIQEFLSTLTAIPQYYLKELSSELKSFPDILKSSQSLENLLTKKYTLSTVAALIFVFFGIPAFFSIFGEGEGTDLPEDKEETGRLAEESILWNDLFDRVVPAWDVITAQEHLFLLSESENQCVAQFSSRLSNSLSEKGGNGFLDIPAIQQSLEREFGCSFLY